MPHKPGMIPNMGDISAATRVQLAGIGTAPRTRRRKKTATKKRVRRKRSVASSRTRARNTGPKRRARKTGSRLKKGSPAAKRHMAKLRAMKRKR